MISTSRRAALRAAMATIVAGATLGSRLGWGAEPAGSSTGTSAAGTNGTGTNTAGGNATGGKKWDVIVVGAGVFGAWTAWKLHEQGKSVLLVDAWGPAHSRASSGGESRLIRTEYGGDELYTRMAWESLPQWQALSQRSGLPIFLPVGALYLYQHASADVANSLALHARLGIPAQKLSRAELAARYPQIGLDRIEFGVLQPTMGALMARRAVQTLVAQFVAAGGTYRQVAVAPPRAGASLDAIDVGGAGTGAAAAGGGDSGGSSERLRADQFVFACGPWLPKLFPDVVGSRIQPTRQDVFFFAPEAGDTRFEAGHLPAWVDRDDEALHYGFPVLEARGFKIALDAHGPKFDPDTGERQITAPALAAVREYLARRFPGIARRPLAESRVCQYENSENGDFLIDRHPAWHNTWIVGGGSGHGFKHGPAVGRYVSEIVTGTLRTAEPRFAWSHHATQASVS